MAKKVTVYTTNTCASCRQIKQWLDMKGVAYNTVNLDEHPEERQPLIAMSGAMTVPITVIEDENGAKDITVGLNLSKLAGALA